MANKNESGPWLCNACLLTALFLLLPSRSTAESSPQWDPIPVENQSLLHLSFLSMPPSSAYLLPAGAVSVSLNEAYSNTLESGVSAGYSAFFDYELSLTKLSLAWGLSPRITLEGHIPIIYYYGGHLDGFVNGFHEALGITSEWRKKTPDGLFDYRLLKGTEAIVSADGESGGLGDVSVHCNVLVREEGPRAPALTLRSAIKCPTGRASDLHGSGGWDGGVGLALSKSLRSWALHLNTNLLLLTPPEGLEHEMRNLIFSSAFATTYALGRHLGLVAQCGFQTPHLHDTGVDELDGVVLTAQLGIGYRPSERITVITALGEDLINNASADFTLFTRLSYTFGLTQK